MKRLTVGADPFPPYQYYDQVGNIQGLDYQLVKKIFKSAGYKIKVILAEWNKIEDALIDKKIDAAFQVQHTSEREKKYFFSKLFRYATTEVVTGSKRLRLNSYAEIEEKQLSIGVINNYTYGDGIDQLDSSLKVRFSDQSELLKAINDQVVELGIFDQGVKEHLLKQKSYPNIYSIKNLEFIRPLYVVFSNKGIRDKFNQNMKTDKLIT